MQTTPGPQTTSKETTQAGRGLGYVPPLDGVRGVAVLLVTFYHAVNRPRGGLIGVTIFFALSGFLITTLLLREWTRTDRISFKRFYLRRVLRLFPALAGLLAVYLVLIVVLDPPQLAMRARGALISFLYLSNWAMAFQIPFPTELAPLWSVSVEEQFYLLWPPLLYLLLKRKGSVVTARNALLGVLLALIVWRMWWAFHGTSNDRLYFATDMRMDEILFGCGAAILLHTHPAIAEKIARYLWLPGVLIIAAVAAVPTTGYYPPLVLGMFSAAAISAAIVILSCVTASQGLPARFLSSPALVFFGAISYSLYLWQFPIMFAVDEYVLPDAYLTVKAAALTVPLSLAASIVSFYVIERPFLRLKDRLSLSHDAKPHIVETTMASVLGFLRLKPR